MKIIESCKKRGTTVADTEPGDVFSRYAQGPHYIRVGTLNVENLFQEGCLDVNLVLCENGQLGFLRDDLSCTIHPNAVLVLEPK